MSRASNHKEKSLGGELEVSGYFETGWRGEGEEEIPGKNNLSSLVWVIFFVLGLFFLRVSYLQIIQGKFYTEKAEENRAREVVIEAPRGIIYDRNHKILASNKPKFDLMMIPGLLPKDTKERRAILKAVAEKMKLEADELEVKYQEIDQDSFSPILIEETLEREKALEIEINLVNWPGVILQKKAKRLYPLTEAAAHLLGYNGKISEEELKNHPDYSISDIIGKEGLEESYEKYLRGIKGGLQFEINAKGKAKRIIGNKNPIIGKSLVLNTNSDLEQEAYNILKEKIEESGGTGGSVVAINPRDGGILALTNYPAYDNNEFEGKISPERFNELFGSEEKPMFDRAIGGTYPPGSTFKPLIAAAALEKKIITPGEALDCPAVLQIGQWEFPDWKYHGLTDLNKAIAESVNTYFYIVGGGWGDRKGLGADNIKYYATQTGMGSRLGIDISQEALGLVPDAGWKKKAKGESWYIGDTYHLSIGQGDVLTTPLQIASYVSALVNGGTLYQPRIVDYVENIDGSVMAKKKPAVIRQNIFSPETLAAVKKAMEATVSSESGSGRSLQELENKYGIKIGGKTGTAQTSEDDRYHAWFVGFAPVENPEIVVVALVERGGEGYSAALPVAGRVIDKYFEKRQAGN